MFIIKDAKTEQTTKTNDIRDSFDIIIGITGDESEALRVYAIMSNMLFGDKFSNTKYSIECVRDIPDNIIDKPDNGREQPQKELTPFDK